MTHKSLLCVGGPRSGQRYEIHKGNGFIVPVITTPTGFVNDLPNSGMVEITHIEYRAELFRTPQGDVLFWVPVSQTPFETITLLLESYERANGL